MECEYLPQVRSGHETVVYKRRLYLFGGRFSDQRKESLVEIFDCDTLKWLGLPQTLTDNKIEHTCNMYSNYMLLFGGYENQRLFNDLRIFDLETLTWGTASRGDNQAAMQTPPHRYAHCSVVIEHDLFVVGGMDQKKPLSDMWRFSLESSK